MPPKIAGAHLGPYGDSYHSQLGPGMEKGDRRDTAEAPIGVDTSRRLHGRGLFDLSIVKVHRLSQIRSKENTMHRSKSETWSFFRNQFPASVKETNLHANEDHMEKYSDEGKCNHNSCYFVLAGVPAKKVTARPGSPGQKLAEKAEKG